VDNKNPNKIVLLFVIKIVLCHRYMMARDSWWSFRSLHASVVRPTHYHRTTTIGEMQLDANTETKSRVRCFSSLLNFNSNESTHINTKV